MIPTVTWDDIEDFAFKFKMKFMNKKYPLDELLDVNFIDLNNLLFSNYLVRIWGIKENQVLLICRQFYLSTFYLFLKLSFREPFSIGNEEDVRLVSRYLIEDNDDLETKFDYAKT